jgi:hypothetical protein
MRDLGWVRVEIDRMRFQISRQHRELVQLQRAGIGTSAAEALLQRMQETLRRLREQRELLKVEEAKRLPRKQRSARHG